MKGRLRAPGLEALFVATFVLYGFRLGARPIHDNSMFTHLRTGIDMARGLGIPRSDPYSFTAAGTDWVVQSWLPELTYGWAHRIGGLRLVVLEQALLVAGLAWLVVRLARAGSPLRSALAALVVVGLGSPYWSPRPLLFGLICLALTITVVEGRRSPWLLVPVVWLWVSSHGSFPLGLAWLGARALGEAIEWRAWPRDALRYAVAFGAGLVVSVLNPLGARILAFPFALGERREAFQQIIEWMSPNFQRGSNRVALVFLVVALVVLAKARVPWRDAVPAVVFLAAGLLALRNLPVTAVVLAPVMGRALRRPSSDAPAPGPPTAPRPANGSRAQLNRVFAGTIAAAFVVFGASVLAAQPLRLRAYPVDATTFLQREGLLADDHRVAHQDFVGNYLELRYGRRVSVFVDDRYDMYPVAVSADYRRLLGGRSQSAEILDRYRVDVVLWKADLPLVALLKAGGGWQELYAKDGWTVLRRG